MDLSSDAVHRRSGRSGRTLLAVLVITVAVVASIVALPGGIASADPLVTGTHGDPMVFTVVADEAGDRAVVLLGTDGTDTIDPDVETVRVRIEWGDGDSTDRTEVGFVTHAYAAAGTYTVRIWPLYADAGGSDTGPWLTLYGANRAGGSFYWAPLGDDPEDEGDIARMTAVGSFGDLGITSLNNAFNRHRYLIDVPDTLPSTVIDLGYMFRYGIAIDDAGISSWDVSKVTDLEGLFEGATSFDQPIGSWEVGAVTTLRSTFEGATSFDQDLSGWDVSSVTTMENTFEGATSFDQPIGSWNVGSVTTMRDMFQNAVAFDQDLTSWNVSSVTTMENMFEGAAAFNGDISSWKERVGNVQDFSDFLKGATSFDQDLPDWDVSGSDDLDSFFEGATSFDGSLAGWTFSSTVGVDVSNMFEDASAFNQNLSSWNTNSIDDMNDMFYGAEAFDGDVTSWDVSNVLNMDNMFRGAIAFDRDLSSWDVSSVEDMDDMFNGATSFDGDVSSWAVSSVTDMDDMFNGATSFDQDLSSWDVSSVTGMTNMFDGAAAFDRSLGAWQLATNVNLSAMLDDSGMSTACYDATLNGWAALDPAVTGRSLGAAGLVRSTDSAAAYTTLDGDRSWTISDAGDGGEPGGRCAAPTAAAPAPSGPRVTVVTAPSVAGDPVIGQVSGGDAGIDILWRLVGPDGATLVEGPVTLDDAGEATIATSLPSSSAGGYRLVLVEWDAEDSFVLGMSGGPVPTSVPAGEGPGNDPAVLLVVPVLLTFAVLRRRRAWTV